MLDAEKEFSGASWSKGKRYEDQFSTPEYARSI